MEKLKFYYCEVCTNLFTVLHDSGVNPVCCDQDMTILEPNSSGASEETHKPAVTRDGAEVSVQVGAKAHPMLDAHYIQFVIVQQGDHIQRMDLKPNGEPTATFTLKDADAPINVYEHCNLHGLWMTEA